MRLDCLVSSCPSQSSHFIRHAILGSHIDSIRSPASGFDMARSAIGRASRKYGNAVINHAGIRIVREGATLIPTVDAHAQHPSVSTKEDLAGLATATAPEIQLASQQRHGVMQTARSKKENYS